jgi:hypothetical protein
VRAAGVNPSDWQKRQGLIDSDLTWPAAAHVTCDSLSARKAPAHHVPCPRRNSKA